MKTVSFLASGRGSNFEACMTKISEGYIKAKPGILISDKNDAGALTLAEEFSMKSRWISTKEFANRESHEKEIYKYLKEAKTDILVLAGYMRILSPFLIKKFPNRIINIHPALLPAFPGVNAQKQAIEYGVKVTGCTAHFVDSGVDTGPIILQDTVFIENSDTVSSLSKKILEREHVLLPKALKLLCEDRIKVIGRQVVSIR